MNKERGIGHIVTLIIGLTLILVIVGFFRANRSFFDTINYKALLRLPPGITVEKIEPNQKVVFPLKVTGYINGAGWEMGSRSAGTVQVFDKNGKAVTAPMPLLYGDMSSELPRPFAVILRPYQAPTADSGQILFTSTTGLIHAIPVTF